jgi:predicted restriction endonuclease
MIGLSYNYMREYDMTLEKEQAFYEVHRDELRAKYLGKRIVIVGNEILGVYDTDREAINETEKTRPLGTFMVKYIPVDPDDEVITIYSPRFTPVIGT